MRPHALLKLPNLVSLSRLPMGGAFMLIDDTMARASLLAAAALTDGLDGWLARKRGERTPEGAILDPLTDHAFVGMALIAYVVGGSLTLGEAIVLVIHDIATSVAYLASRLIPSLRGAPFEARFLGKAVTGLQLLTLVMVLLMPASPDLLVPIVGMVSIVAVVDYAIAFWRGHRGRGAQPAEG